MKLSEEHSGQFIRYHQWKGTDEKITNNILSNNNSDLLIALWNWWSICSPFPRIILYGMMIRGKGLQLDHQFHVFKYK